MGYDFYGKHRKTDDEYIFTTECMYAYQPIFKECFSKDIKEFNGRVTKRKVEEFKLGVDKLSENPDRYNLNHKQMMGYLGNKDYAKLVEELYELYSLMKSKDVGYLEIS